MKLKILITILLLNFLLTACYQKEKFIKITDFSMIYADTLHPKKDGSYASSVLRIRGYVNDTISVEFYGIEKRIKGNIDIKFDADYYGMIDVYFIFDPLKATEGELEIRYGIY